MSEYAERTIIVCHEKQIRSYDMDPNTPGIQWVYEVEGDSGVSGIRSALLRRCTFASRDLGQSLIVYAPDFATGMLAALSAVLFGVATVDPSLARELLDHMQDNERATLAAQGPLN